MKIGLLIALAMFTTLATCAAALAQAPAAIVVPSAVDADGYKYWIPSATLVNSKAKQGEFLTLARAVLTGSKSLKEYEANFKNYYAIYLFPMLTQTSDEALANLPNERFKFFRDHLEYCKVAEVHAYLADLALTQFQAVVDDNFHPAVRYNAMLIISSLNDQDPVRVGAAPATPEPMLRALPVILDEFQKPENTDAIRAAAMVGLIRHLDWDNFKSGPPIPAPLKASVVKVLLDLATAKTPPAGRNAGGHEWFRRRAIEGLAHAGYIKVDPAVAAAFEKMLKDDSETLAVRCAVAAAIGKLTYQAPTALAAQATAREMGYLAVLACDQELTRVVSMKKLEEERASRLSGDLGQAGAGPGGGEGPGGRRPPGMPSRPAMGGDILGGPSGLGVIEEDPKQYRFDYVRRKIRAQLHSLQFGLTAAEDKARGTRSAAKAPAELKYVNDVKAAIDELAKSLENADGQDLATLETGLRGLMKPLEAMTRKVGAAPVAPPVEGPGDIPPPVAPPTAAPAVPSPPPMPVAAPAVPAAAGNG